MNPFQWLTLPVLLLALGWDLLRLCVPGSGRRWWRMLRIAVWLLAAVAILQPERTSAVAQLLGIGRGTDLLVYALCLVFLATSSFWYTRTSQLERQITELTRHIALREAQRGPDRSLRELGP
jgi:hypothetical protein